MDDSYLNKLDSYFTEFIKINYKKGSTILRPEDSPQGIYYIKKGFIKNYCVSESGKEIILNIFKPGSYFPIYWALTGAKNLYFYEAMTNTSVYRAPKLKTVKFLLDEPKTLLNLTCRVLVGLEATLNRLYYTMSGNAQKKIISTLLFLAKRFGTKENGNVLISLPITHLCIASLSGVTRETTSIIMKEIEKKGIISYQKRHILIKNIKKLTQESLYLQTNT